MLKDDIDAVLNSGLKEIETADAPRTLGDLRVKFLGKSGQITAFLKELKNVSPSEKPAFGKLVNDVRVKMEEALAAAEAKIADKERAARIKSEALDVTLSLPQATSEEGALSPLTLVKNDILDIFTGMGFTVEDGPEIEFVKYNFRNLNIPDDHPARDMTDTFYISDDMLLRTQTSAVQVHTMEDKKPPIKVICPGKVYRPDDDATHSPMFQQIEGLVIDEHITLSDLKNTLDLFAKSYFSADTQTRLRPSHFPFTEPSVEVDLSCPMCHGKGCRLCKGTGWIELLGAGVVNPVVLDMCGIDSKKYSGYAFGMGVERATMVKYGVPDMRLIFDNDVRYLKQFK